jgi:hypothetical protein
VGRTWKRCRCRRVGVGVGLGSSVAHEVGEEVEVVGSWHGVGGREVGHGCNQVRWSVL